MNDMWITCVQCDKDFIWTAEEQEFYASKGFTRPRRCAHCRPDRSEQRKRLEGSGGKTMIRNPMHGFLDEKLRNGIYIDQEKIVEFIQKVEDHRGFRRDVRLVFAHLVEEVGELSHAIWEYEKLSEIPNTTEYMPDYQAGDASPISRELIDIIFLACYLADILAVRLDEIIPKRMAEIQAEYGIPRDDRQ